MVSIFVIAILASFLLMAMSGVRERAKERRALTQVVRVQELLMRRLDDYRVRSVPLRVSAGANPRLIPLARLLVIRELMRLEIPDRKSDVIDPPVGLPSSFGAITSRLSGGSASPPALHGVYQRRAMRATGSATLAQLEANWSIQNQSSECLYLVLSALQEGEANGTDFLKDSEVGDTDGDGMLEVLDPWEKPIVFLRWAPGAFTPLQTPNRNEAPDPFDLVKKDPRWGDPADAAPFALYPLVISGGPDEQLGVVLDDSTTPLRYINTQYAGNPFPNDPFTIVNDAAVGNVGLGQSNNASASADNIISHALEAN